MTAFEIIVIVLLAAIVMLLAWHLLLTRNNYSLNQTKELKRQQDFKRLSSQLWGIKAEIGQTNGRIDGFIPAFKKLLEHNESIENFWASDSSLVIKLLKELVDIEHKSDERNDNMFPFMQEIMRNYNPPCYSPNGICTNPQMDCINCPKRGTGGTWSTSTNKVKED